MKPYYINEVTTSSKTVLTLKYNLRDPEVASIGYFPLYATDGRITDCPMTLQKAYVYPGYENILTLEYDITTSNDKFLYMSLEMSPTIPSSYDEYKAYRNAQLTWNVF